MLLLWHEVHCCGRDKLSWGHHFPLCFSGNHWYWLSFQDYVPWGSYCASAALVGSTSHQNYGFWIDTVKRLWCGWITIIIGLLLLLLCPATAWFSEASLSRNSSVFVVNWFFFSCSVFLFQLSPSGWTVWSSNFKYANRDNLSMFVFSILFRLTQVVVWRKSQ